MYIILRDNNNNNNTLVFFFFFHLVKIMSMQEIYYRHTTQHISDFKTWIRGNYKNDSNFMTKNRHCILSYDNYCNIISGYDVATRRMLNQGPTHRVLTSVLLYSQRPSNLSRLKYCSYFTWTGGDGKVINTASLKVILSKVNVRRGKPGEVVESAKICNYVLLNFGKCGGFDHRGRCPGVTFVNPPYLCKTIILSV